MNRDRGCQGNSKYIDPGLDPLASSTLFVCLSGEKASSGGTLKECWFPVIGNQFVDGGESVTGGGLRGQA